MLSHGHTSSLIAFHDPQLMLPFAAFCVLCDILIAFAVFKYMWRSSFRRRRSTIQDLARVCIMSGATTWYARHLACNHVPIMSCSARSHSPRACWYVWRRYVAHQALIMMDTVGCARRQHLGRCIDPHCCPEQVPSFH